LEIPKIGDSGPILGWDDRDEDPKAVFAVLEVQGGQFLQ
jgi:hypothetical protein